MRPSSSARIACIFSPTPRRANAGPVRGNPVLAPRRPATGAVGTPFRGVDSIDFIRDSPLWCLDRRLNSACKKPQPMAGASLNEEPTAAEAQVAAATGVAPDSVPPAAAAAAGELFLPVPGPPVRVRE